MSKRKPVSSVALPKLMDAIIISILESSDEEALEDDEELIALGAPSAGDFVSSALQRARISEGKARFSEAERLLAEEESNSGGVVVPLRREELRASYTSKAERLSEKGIELSLAARNGRKMSDSDFDSALEDLAELGAFDDDIESNGQ